MLNGFKGLANGKREIDRFKTELRDYFDEKHIFLTSSGKSALTLILRALHELHPDRDEVLIPAFCCYSIPSAIIRAGLKIKLCDVNPDTLDFNFKDLEKILSNDLIRSTNGPNNRNQISVSRLLAIVPVHLFGLPANIDRLRGLINDPNISIVEDAAQVFGGKSNGKKLGTLGDVNFFSLGRGKAISIVDGGIILTKKPDIAASLNDLILKLPEYSLLDLIRLILKAVGLLIFQHPSLFWLPRSLPYLRVGDTIYDPGFMIKKMSSFQAGLTKGWNKKLNRFTKCRKKLSIKWLNETTRCISHNYINSIEDIPSFIRFPVRIDELINWNKILKQSQQMGLGIMFTYPDSINKIQELKDVFHNVEFPGAKNLANRLITFPIHPLVSSNDLKKIEKFLVELKN
jgi:dTDP-4-amino-4,6-dideoxygalactose transaminase